jgi:hypothetical protein
MARIDSGRPAGDHGDVDAPVVIARVSSLVEAQLVVGMLESSGIAAATSSDDAGGFDPQLQLTQGVRVLVSAEDEASARRLMAEAKADRS